MMGSFHGGSKYYNCIKSKTWEGRTLALPLQNKCNEWPKVVSLHEYRIVQLYNDEPDSEATMFSGKNNYNFS